MSFNYGLFIMYTGWGGLGWVVASLCLHIVVAWISYWVMNIPVLGNRSLLSQFTTHRVLEGTLGKLR